MHLTVTFAINGGSKVIDYTPGVSWPTYNDKDLHGLKTVWEQKKQGKNGPASKKFAKRFAEYNNVKHCILCANGTVALSLVLRGLEIGRGDEVIIPPYTFIATISSVIYSGATPVFADIDPTTCNLSIDSVRSKITKRTKSVIPVSIGGRPADMDIMDAFAKETGLYIINDAAQAVGSAWRGKGIGSYGIAATFSCQNTKNLTCGEGGIITTNDDVLAENVKKILNGGVDENGEYSYVGIDYNMTEWQAALLDSQMDKLDAEISRRMDNAEYLDSLLESIPCVSSLAKDARITKNSYHFYVMRLNAVALAGVTRDTFFNTLAAEGAGVVNGYVPLYTFPCLSNSYTTKTVGCEINLSPGTPTAENISYNEAIWLMHTKLLDDKKTIKDLADAIIKVYEHLYELGG